MPLALVVPDRKVALFQNMTPQLLARPLQIAVTDPQLLAPQLRDQLRQELVGSQTSQSLELLSLANRNLFFSADSQSRFDVLLTTAEGGSSWAVLHPRTTLIAPFQDRLASELV